MHTVQTPGAWEILRTKGRLIGDASRGETIADFQGAEAYAWLAGHLADHVGSSVDGMVWLWARTRRSWLRDLMRSNPRDVLISVRVPRERVLLSDYFDWHLVLNRSLDVPLRPGETMAAWDARFDLEWNAWADRTDAFRQLPIEAWPPEERAELEASWSVVLDVDRSDFRPVQATVTELLLSDVTSAVRIV